MYSPIIDQIAANLQPNVRECITTGDLGALLLNAIAQLPADVFPPRVDILAAFRGFSTMADVRVTIVGEDPYPNDNADGLAFSRALIANEAIPQSLRTIVDAAVHQKVADIAIYNLEHWRNNGILLLNTYLTSEANRTKHVFWHAYTSAILAKLPNSIFMLWGRHAQQFHSTILAHNPAAIIYTTTHPSPLAQNRLAATDKFANTVQFREVAAHLGMPNIWQLCPPVTETITEPVVETIIEPVTETITEPVVETIIEPVTETIINPATETIINPATETIINPATETITEPVTETIINPATETITEPVTETITEPVTEPIINPATETIIEPVTEPITEPVAETITEPVTETITEPVAETIIEPVAETITEPVAETITEPVVETIIEHVAETIIEHVAETIIEPVTEPADVVKYQHNTTDVATGRIMVYIPKLNTSATMLTVVYKFHTHNTTFLTRDNIVYDMAANPRDVIYNRIEARLATYEHISAAELLLLVGTAEILTNFPHRVYDTTFNIRVYTRIAAMGIMLKYPHKICNWADTRMRIKHPYV